MMKLATSQALRDRMGLPHDKDGVNRHVELALLSATSLLASALDTDFEQATCTDIWYYSQRRRPQHRKDLRFKLARGFVNDTPAVVIKTAICVDDLATATPITSDCYKLYLEKGQLHVYDTGSYPHISRIFGGAVCDETFVQAEYTAGFTKKKDEASFVAENVPAWLEEAALATAREYYHEAVDQDTSEERNRTKATNDARDAVFKRVSILLERYIRFYPSYLNTQFSDCVLVDPDC